MEKIKTILHNPPAMENPNDLSYYPDKNGCLKRNENLYAKLQKLMQQIKKDR